MINDSGSIDPTGIDQTKMADIMQNINNTATIALIVAPPIDSDLKIINDNSTTTIQKYLNTTTGIIEEGLFSPSNGILQGLSSGGIGIKSDYPSYYQNIYNSLKAIEVPSSWKEIHKSTLTSFLQLSSSFKAMMTLQEDPVKASFALQQIQSSFLGLTGILNSASRLAKSQNVPTDSIMQMVQSANIYLPAQTGLPVPK